MNKTVDTRICDVTVYSNQALVTRRGVVQLTGDEHELVIAQLPVTLLSESIRVRNSGALRVRLLGVRTERTCATEEVAQKIAQLNQEIGQIEEQKRPVQDGLTLLNLQRNFVKSLSSQYLERLTKFQDPEQMNLNQIRELMDFVGQQYNDFSDAIAQLEKEQKQLDSKLQSLRQQLQQLSGTQPPESFNLMITVEPSAVGELELEISYIVYKASWTPLYDMRLGSSHEKINISYLAEIKQSTGEDWRGVALTLSTAKPGIGTLPAKLTPWYIDVQQPNQFRTPTLSEPASLPSRTLAATMPFAGTTPSTEAMMKSGFEYGFTQTAAPDASKPGGSITYRINSTSYIPSDGVPHKTTILNEDFPCRAEYMALARVSPLAYLQATITNLQAGVMLLAGKVNIFLDQTFVGTTQLDNIAPGQEFKLNLGSDEGIVIQRDLVERQVDPKLMGNQRHRTYAYRLVITNFRECEVKLKLTEQLPVSRHEQVKVRLTLSNPEIEVGEMGMVEWSLTLPPLSGQELYYQFAIEHPPEFTIVGLEI